MAIPLCLQPCVPRLEVGFQVLPILCALVTPSTPTAVSERCQRYARSRAGTSIRCASEWNRPWGLRCGLSTIFTSSSDMSLSGPWTWFLPEVHINLGRLCSAGFTTTFPDVTAPRQFSDSPVPMAVALAPLVSDLPRCGRLLYAQWLTTSPHAHVPCVGDGAPALRKTRILQGKARASQGPGQSSSGASWSNTPPDTRLSSLCLAKKSLLRSGNSALYNRLIRRSLWAQQLDPVT
jgi:hypothetical protein